MFIKFWAMKFLKYGAFICLITFSSCNDDELGIGSDGINEEPQEEQEGGQKVNIGLSNDFFNDQFEYYQDGIIAITNADGEIIEWNKMINGNSLAFVNDTDRQDFDLHFIYLRGTPEINRTITHTFYNYETLDLDLIHYPFISGADRDISINIKTLPAEIKSSSLNTSFIEHSENGGEYSASMLLDIVEKDAEFVIWFTLDGIEGIYHYTHEITEDLNFLEIEFDQLIKSEQEIEITYPNNNSAYHSIYGVNQNDCAGFQNQFIFNSDEFNTARGYLPVDAFDEFFVKIQIQYESGSLHFINYKNQTVDPIVSSPSFESTLIERSSDLAEYESLGDVTMSKVAFYSQNQRWINFHYHKDDGRQRVRPILPQIQERLIEEYLIEKDDYFFTEIELINTSEINSYNDYVNFAFYERNENGEKINNFEVLKLR